MPQVPRVRPPDELARWFRHGDECTDSTLILRRGGDGDPLLACGCRVVPLHGGHHARIAEAALRSVERGPQVYGRFRLQCVRCDATVFRPRPTPTIPLCPDCRDKRELLRVERAQAARKRHDSRLRRQRRSR